MLRSIKNAATYSVTLVSSAVILLVSWPLLFWLGRSSPPSELVVDPELIEDDSGVDVD